MNHFRLRLQVFLVIFSGIIVFGTLGFASVERLSLVDAFYFTIVTISTVGYGDIYPLTSLGKILAVILLITGVGTFLGVIANGTEMILTRREMKARLEKLNMVIGTFFSEVGTNLLLTFSRVDPQIKAIQKELLITGNFDEKDFLTVSKNLKNYNYSVLIHNIDLESLRSFLLGKRDSLLRLLENPAILEHESFTDLLRAVFHLTEELSYRFDIKALPDTDINHLSGDIKRAYKLLVLQWLNYMRYLKDNYPYLFSLAMRINPFDENANPVVK